MQIDKIIEFFKESRQRTIYAVMLLIGILFHRQMVVLGNSLVGKLFFIFAIIWFTMKLGLDWGLILVIYFIDIIGRGSHTDNLEGFDDMDGAAATAAATDEGDASASAADEAVKPDRSPIEIENDMIRPVLSNDSYEENAVNLPSATLSSGNGDTSTMPLITDEPAAVNMNELTSSSFGSG